MSDPYSNLKIFRHHEKMDALLKGKITPPIYVRVKPTNRCNHKCYYCSYADKKDLNLRTDVNRKDTIPWNRLKGVLNDFGDIGVKAVTFSGGGEPIVYPNIADAMRLTLKNKIDLSIITNGQNLCGENAEILTNAKWVRISMDSCDATNYSKIRGIPKKSFYKVSDNIKKFSKIKDKKCELGINFVINLENADSVYKMAKYVKELGVNHIKYAARITSNLHDYHSKFKENVIKQIHKAEEDFSDKNFKIINKYEGDFNTSGMFERTYNKCLIMQCVSVVAADSKVYTCHDKAYVSNGILGDLREKTFKEIWFSKETKKFFNEFDPMKYCNHHCVFDNRNILLNNYMGLEDQHQNFI